MEISPALARSVDLCQRYTALGNLDDAAAELGISHQRASQLIARGVRAGLFERPRKRARRPVHSRETVIDVLQQCRSLREAEQMLGYGPKRMRAEIERLRLQPELQAMECRRAEQRSTATRARIYAEYLAFVDELGHHPATQEFQQRNRWTLYVRIVRHFGSITIFRDANDIRRNDGASCPARC